MIVSTHSPARGLTYCQIFSFPYNRCFNSQPRKGADRAASSANPGRRVVSTHSPARGLTAALFWYMIDQNVSTHSPARGLTDYTWDQVNLGFVSTHSPARGLTAILHNFRIFPMHVSVLIALNHSFIHIAPDIFLQYRPVFTVRMFRDISVYLYFAL